MLIVKCEMHDPDTGEMKEITRMVITNDGRGSKYSGNYTVEIFKDNKQHHIGFVQNWQRERDPLWCLVSTCLAACGFYARWRGEKAV